MSETFVAFCKLNVAMKTLQALGLHLNGYEEVPCVTEPTGTYLPFNFKLSVKRDMPLFANFGVVEVVVYTPPGSGDFAILLIGDVEAREGPNDPLSFLDDRRFDSVCDLVLFMDTLAETASALSNVER